jgi:Matrixin
LSRRMLGALALVTLAIAAQSNAMQGFAGQGTRENQTEQIFRPDQRRMASTVAAPRKFLGFELLDLDGRHVRWGGNGSGPVTVTYAFLTKPAKFASVRNCVGMVSPDQLLENSNISQRELRKEVAAAFRMWESVAAIRFKETTDTGSAGILIGAQERPVGRAFADVAYAANNSDVNVIERSLVCLNPTRPWKIGFDGNNDVYDVRYTMAHEIGHAIGLDHPGRSGQLMSYRYEERFRDLQAGDIAGAVMLYGSP